MGQKNLDEVRRIAEANGLVVIIAGSDSDEPHIKKLGDALDKLALPYEVRIFSAHKQPDMAGEIISGYNELRTPLAFVSVAGGTDALSGMLSFHSLHPVISCPPDASNQSCLTNPPGSANAYIARPENVAIFIAQMFCSRFEAYRTRLQNITREKVASLYDADKKLSGSMGIARELGANA